MECIFPVLRVVGLHVALVIHEAVHVIQSNALLDNLFLAVRMIRRVVQDHQVARAEQWYGIHVESAKGPKSRFTRPLGVGRTCFPSNFAASGETSTPNEGRGTGSSEDVEASEEGAGD